ncbi:MAG: hypothetical protein HZA16_14750 [Nitrospirae bacterium]|nr:hypothetical protein [Nitrospirota bacterium]
MSYYDWTYLYIFLAALALLIIIYLVVKALKKRKKPENIITPLRPAHETALEALRDLMNKNYLNAGKAREHYFELSDIVRHYVEDRFQLRAPEMTTEEFLLTLQDSNTLNVAQKTILKEFLSHCDMVKFARYLPDEEETEASYESAKRFIEETKESTKS